MVGSLDWVGPWWAVAATIRRCLTGATRLGAVWIVVVVQFMNSSVRKDVGGTPANNNQQRTGIDKGSGTV